MPRPHPKKFRDDVVAVARRGFARRDVSGFGFGPVSFFPVCLSFRSRSATRDS